MKTDRTVGKIKQKSAVDSSRASSSGGEKGVAIKPPDYGIGFVDGGMEAVAPVQLVGSAGRASASAPAAPTPETAPNRTGLPNQLKNGIENLSGYSMDDVKVHYNSSKPAALNAHAYAQGTDIHLGAGQERHLPHEAWHVVQQKQGRVRPTLQMKGAHINDEIGMEKEADLMGEKAILQRKCKNCNSDTTPSNLLSGKKEKELQYSKQLSAINGTTIQRVCGDNDASKFSATDNPEYGGLSNDSGSCMDVLINPVSSGGSKVSSWPSWWPVTGSSDRAVLNKYMVQGHLWNKELGGPGNARDNLTPITASANSQHSAKVESPLKTDLKLNTIVHYVVSADYSAAPHEAEIAPGNLADQAVVKKYVGNMAKGIHAEYTVYNGTTQAEIKSNSWDIGNEHSSVM